MYANGLFFGTFRLPVTSFDLLSYAAGLTPMRLAPFYVATGLGMTPAIIPSTAAADLGVWSPWALIGGLVGIATLAALAVALRPWLLRWLSGTSAESSRGA